jgi:predicted nucleic acid-binding protein
VSVFVDTGMLFAAAAVRDKSHARAVEVLGEIEDDRPFTSDHVLIETRSLLDARFGYDAGMRFWSASRETVLAIEFVGPVDLERAYAISEGWMDQEFDIVDTSSFAVMERVGCRRAATFDNDFAVYRFGPDRKQAFAIVR